MLQDHLIHIQLDRLTNLIEQIILELQKLTLVTQKLNPSAGGGFGTAGAINSVLVAMVLFEPGTMKISGAEEKLPAWLLPSYQQIFAHPLVQQA